MNDGRSVQSQMLVESEFQRGVPPTVIGLGNGEKFGVSRTQVPRRGVRV